MKNLVLLAFSTIMFSSCAFHSGYMSNSVALSQANFDYIKNSISGEAKTTLILGFGGLSRDAIVEEAKADMLKNNSLKANQGLANTTVNFKTTSYAVVQIQKCTVTADVVEFK